MKHIFWIVLAAIIFLVVSALALEPTFFANEFDRIYHLYEHAQLHETDSRKAQAIAIGKKTGKYYQTLESICLTESTEMYWCKHDSWKSRLPLIAWPLKQESVSIRFECTANALRAIVTLDNVPLLMFLLKDGTFTELKQPHGNSSGMKTSYPYDPNWTRLTAGIDPYLLCLTGFYRSTWVGPESSKAQTFERMISHGLRVGSVRVNGIDCDLVVADYSGDLEVFYIDDRGFVRRWLKVKKYNGEDPRCDRFVQVCDFDLVSDSSLPPGTFEIPSSWEDASRSWPTLTAQESKELLDMTLAESQGVLLKEFAESQRKYEKQRAD